MHHDRQAIDSIHIAPETDSRSGDGQLGDSSSDGTDRAFPRLNGRGGERCELDFLAEENTDGALPRVNGIGDGRCELERREEENIVVLDLPVLRGECLSGVGVGSTLLSGEPADKREWSECVLGERRGHAAPPSAALAARRFAARRFAPHSSRLALSELIRGSAALLARRATGGSRGPGGAGAVSDAAAWAGCSSREAVAPAPAPAPLLRRRGSRPRSARWNGARERAPRSAPGQRSSR